MHKLSEIKTTTRTPFENLPDGTYPAVLDKASLELENKYGPRLNLTFKLPNNRLAWVDLRENKAKQLNGAWYNLKNLGIQNEVREALKEEYTTEDFLTAASNAVSDLVGHYFDIEASTFQANNKQYWKVNAVGDQIDFDGFEMPKKQEAPPTIDANDDIPF